MIENRSTGMWGRVCQECLFSRPSGPPTDVTQPHLPSSDGLNRVLGLVLHGAAKEKRQLPDIQEGVLVGRTHVHAVQLHHTTEGWTSKCETTKQKQGCMVASHGMSD